MFLSLLQRQEAQVAIQLGECRHFVGRKLEIPHVEVLFQPNTSDRLWNDHGVSLDGPADDDLGRSLQSTHVIYRSAYALASAVTDLVMLLGNSYDGLVFQEVRFISLPIDMGVVSQRTVSRNNNAVFLAPIQELVLDQVRMTFDLEP